MENKSDKPSPPLDPLQRVFVPIERRNVDGDFVFQTQDGKKYIRNRETGQIRRVKHGILRD